MKVTLKVRRFDPDKGGKTWQDTYTVDMQESQTVLDALIEVREFVDPTLTLRCSCRSAICGSCAMRINGHPLLAGKTKLTEAAPKGEAITVEPMGNMPVVKDLVTDMERFWSKVRSVQPWLQPSGPPPEREYLVPNEDMIKLTGMINCIMCGSCVSDCNSMAVDPNFIGPAALAKALRFVGDPRDGAHKERLRFLTEYSGIWDCTHCFECVQRCPKDVAPMDRILELRRHAEEAGLTNHNGVRHSKVFAVSVKATSWLDEGRLATESFGLLNMPSQLAMLPTALRAAKARKVPAPFFLHHKRPGNNYVRKIFEKLEAKKA